MTTPPPEWDPPEEWEPTKEYSYLVRCDDEGNISEVATDLPVTIKDLVRRHNSLVDILTQIITTSPKK